MKMLRNLGLFASLSLAATLIGSSTGCVFTSDTPDKVEVETSDTPDTDVDIDVDKNY